VPGTIQSIERAAAVLRVLGSAPGPLKLAEISAVLQLPKGTTHGILRTLVEVGFVEQDRETGWYRLGGGLAELGSGQVDRNELRARSMNWADPLASRTHEAVRVGVLVGDEVCVVHYVFRPDYTVQHADVDALLPAHATALGKVLLSHSPRSLPSAGRLTSYTARTITDPARLTIELNRTRARGFGVETGEHLPDHASIAAPIFGPGGLLAGAVSIHGDLDRLCDATGTARPGLVSQVRDCARAITREITRELQSIRSGK
jgi:DNA-binding IclR family transcriptional regulator